MTQDKLTRFGTTSREVLRACQSGPTNPWRHFGKRIRRSWAYSYFVRLAAAGLIKRVPAPAGCRGRQWFVAV